MTSATRFKLAYLLFFAAIGILFNYYALYLQRVGLSGTRVGIVLAVLPLARMLSQPIWGLLGDIYRLRRVILSGTCFGSALAALALDRSDSFIWLLRWLLYTVITIPLLVVPTQLFHSIAMLSLLVAGVLFTDQQLASQWRATGQTAYAAALHGIGPSIGIFAAGAIYEYAGIGMVWWACMIANLIGVGVMAWAVWSPGVALAPDTRAEYLK